MQQQQLTVTQTVGHSSDVAGVLGTGNCGDGCKNDRFKHGFEGRMCKKAGQIGSMAMILDLTVFQFHFTPGTVKYSGPTNSYGLESNDTHLPRF